MNGCKGCDNYRKVDFNNEEISICAAYMKYPKKCILYKKDIGFWDKDGEYQEEIVEVDEEELKAGEE